MTEKGISIGTKINHRQTRKAHINIGLRITSLSCTKQKQHSLNANPIIIIDHFRQSLRNARGSDMIINSPGGIPHIVWFPEQRFMPFHHRSSARSTNICWLMSDILRLLAGKTWLPKSISRSHLRKTQCIFSLCKLYRCVFQKKFSSVLPVMHHYFSTFKSIFR